ncbi:MAG: ECF-family polymerase sigma factor [Labilithrix sp.]|nr:ECF-family polymerase sigma factor [Labilithrix sp.]
MTASTALRKGPALDAEPAERVPHEHARLRRMLDESFDFIWRSLRRFGLSDDRADDAAQQVFIIASRKLDTIRPDAERSFLFGTAMRVASDMRRSAVSRREIAHADPAADLADTATAADELIDRGRARAMLDRVLDAMDEDLRIVFVLFELEETPTAEIAALLGIPPGTVASRLRRAREEFEVQIARIKKRRGGAP